MYLRLIRVVSWLFLVLSFLFLLSVGVAVDPHTLNQWGIVLVFGAFFFFFGSLFFLILTSLSMRFLGEVRTVSYQAAAFRQAGLLSFLLVGLLVAQYMRVLTWWGSCLSLVLILLIELTYRRVSTLRR